MTVYEPTYRQVADQLRRDINESRYPLGAELPSTARLMEMFNVSQRTVRDAMRELRLAGLVDVPGPGRPTTVRVPPARIRRHANERYQHEKDAALAGGLPADTHIAREIGLPEDQATVRLIEREVITGYHDIAELLGIAPDDLIARYTFLVSAGGAGRLAVHFYEARLDAEIAASLPGEPADGRAIWPGGTMFQLARHGIEPGWVRDINTARMPLPEESELLRIPEGVALLCIRKITYDTDGIAREVADVLTPGDRSEAVYDITLNRWTEEQRMLAYRLYPAGACDDSDTID